ncbi:MAG: hypothetical protein V3S24_11645, partial [Candidatus Tectomicrobia bacterium]
MDWSEGDMTRIILISGKGGVGKTTVVTNSLSVVSPSALMDETAACLLGNFNELLCCASTSPETKAS